MSSRFRGVLDAIPAKRQLSQEAGDAVAAGVRQRLSATDMVHPAVRAAGPSARIQGGLYPHSDIHTMVTSDTGVRAQDDYVGYSAYGEYANNVGPQLATRELPPVYQRRGRDAGAGYLSNPFEARGRRDIGLQLMEAPFGGHVRRGLEGAELFGHTVTPLEALRTEQGLAGLTAVGIGVPAFLAAVQQISTPPDQNTIPF
jgi:hypothetical protein